MLVEPARPQSLSSGSPRPSSGERFTSRTELRGAAGTHRSSPGSTPPTRAGSSVSALRTAGKAAAKLRNIQFKNALFWPSEVGLMLPYVPSRSRTQPAWFHVPMLVDFPGCTADSGWSFVVYLLPAENSASPTCVAGLGNDRNERSCAQSAFHRSPFCNI